jgi:hypothetical protein
MQELESKAGKVIGSSLTNRAYFTSSDATIWVTVIECGIAEGVRLTPVVVFTGASLQGQHFPSNFSMEAELPDWKYDYSLTGWSNSEIALKWLKEVYLIETKPKRPGTWRLLIIRAFEPYQRQIHVDSVAEQSSIALLTTTYFAQDPASRSLSIWATEAVFQAKY